MEQSDLDMVGKGKSETTRRRALARLGFAALTAYATPVVLRIQRPALAVTSIYGPCGPDPNGGPPIPCPGD